MRIFSDIRNSHAYSHAVSNLTENQSSFYKRKLVKSINGLNEILGLLKLENEDGKMYKAHPRNLEIKNLNNISLRTILKYQDFLDMIDFINSSKQKEQTFVTQAHAPQKKILLVTPEDKRIDLEYFSLRILDDFIYLDVLGKSQDFSRYVNKIFTSITLPSDIVAMIATYSLIEGWYMKKTFIEYGEEFSEMSKHEALRLERLRPPEN